MDPEEGFQVDDPLSFPVGKLIAFAFFGYLFLAAATWTVALAIVYVAHNV